MLAKRIIPCLDVDNGRVVKGVQFLDIRDAATRLKGPVGIMNKVAEKLLSLVLTLHILDGKRPFGL